MDVKTDIDRDMKGGLISAVVAIGRDRGIGHGNELLWQIPSDMKRFKALTMDHPVIMGRKTWQSIPEKFRPLPGRTNIVITRQAGYEAQGAIVVNSLEEALQEARQAPGADELFIIGGAQLWEEALPFIDRLYLTHVDAQKEADAYFPAYEEAFSKKISEEQGAWDGLTYRWLTLER